MKKSKNKLEDVLHEWQNNFQFREAFKKNPLRALKKSGLTLTKTDLEKIRAQLKLEDKDEKLNERINK